MMHACIIYVYVYTYVEEVEEELNHPAALKSLVCGGEGGGGGVVHLRHM